MEICNLALPPMFSRIRRLLEEAGHPRPRPASSDNAAISNVRELYTRSAPPCCARDVGMQSIEFMGTCSRCGLP